MKKAAWVFVVAVGLLLGDALPIQAWHGRGHGHFHHRVFIGAGPVWWGDPWYPYWWYPPPAYYPPPYGYDEPVEYIEQPRAQAPSRPQGYWYYCPTAKAYYPTVPTCSEEWVPVPPRSE